MCELYHVHFENYRIMKKFFEDFLKAFITGIFIFIILVAVQYLNGFRFTHFNMMLRWFVYNQLYALPLYFVNAYYFRTILNLFSFKVFRFRNLIKSALGSIVLTIITLFLIQLFIITILEGESFSSFFRDQKFENYYFALFLSIVITTIFYTIYYYRNKQETKVKEQKIIAGTASAKYDALKSQLDPHFLFNSLNVLTGLIEENPELASKFTTSLSKVYRYVLEQKDKELVDLEEELKFAERYMSLLSVRFEDSIVYNRPAVLKNPEAKVVPLSLQLLLENTVKHNQVMPSRKLTISIIEENDYLWISNNLQPKESLKTGTGLGLQNIRERYAVFTRNPVKIEKTNSCFRVGIPLLRESVSIVESQDDFLFEKRYKRAQKKVEEIKVFYTHLTVYVIAVPVFIYLNYLSNVGMPWALFPILGWGFGVMSHGFETFNYNPIFSKNWENRKVKKYMDKDTHS